MRHIFQQFGEILPHILQGDVDYETKYNAVHHVSAVLSDQTRKNEEHDRLHVSREDGQESQESCNKWTIITLGFCTVMFTEVSDVLK